MVQYRYPKAVNTLYNEDFNKKKNLVGGHTTVFSSEKERCKIG
jgi:hypothetical protein